MLYLIDNSAFQRISRSSEVRLAMLELAKNGTLCSSPVSTLEAGYSARSSADNRQIINRLTIDFRHLAFTAEIGTTAFELQQSLWAAGKGRSAGVIDLLHAACGIYYQATVIHYDADYDHLWSVDPRLRASWVVPRGSVA